MNKSTLQSLSLNQLWVRSVTYSAFRHKCLRFIIKHTTFFCNYCSVWVKDLPILSFKVTIKTKTGAVLLEKVKSCHLSTLFATEFWLDTEDPCNPSCNLFHFCSNNVNYSFIELLTWQSSRAENNRYIGKTKPYEFEERDLPRFVNMEETDTVDLVMYRFWSTTLCWSQTSWCCTKENKIKPWQMIFANFILTSVRWYFLSYSVGLTWLCTWAQQNIKTCIVTLIQD